VRWLRGLYGWLDDRLGISRAILPVIEHPVPRKVNWWYVFGSATLVAFIFQIITGVALAFTYAPTPNSAYDTLYFITHGAILGSVVRGIHYFGASAMVILIGAHLVRTFLMGSYKFPRELNWLTGVLLFGLTLGMAFSGQLLRWDQDAYWAVVVGASQAARVPIVGEVLAQILLAGQTVGGATLTRFYATHVFLFPALMFGLIGIHLYLVVRHGISEPPEPGHPVDPATYREEYEEALHRDGIPFWPYAAWRDVAFAVGIGVVVLGLSIVVGPPNLGKPADPTNLEAYPRPDWYFLWYFALLALIPPELERWVIVGFPLISFVTLLALPIVAPTGERSLRRRPWAIAAVGLPLLAMAVLLRAGVLAPWSPVMDPGPLPLSVTAPLSGSAARGAQLFEQRGCHSCHSIDGSGGERGPDLTTVGARLSRDQLTTRILAGGENMPAYGETLRPDEVNALVDFLAQQK
jgi:ubiquinol-cytochrome c reductase cytochrome b subunit